MLKKEKARIGPYKIGKKLGQGSFSVVRVGHNVETGEQVAIKILDKAELSRAQAEQSIMDEIAIMERVRHPNIVNLKEVLPSRDKIHLILEHVSEGNLFNRIVRHGPLKETEAKNIFSQLLDGVEFCHMNGVYHRDIKASNVLIALGGSVKLADFGLGAISPNSSSDRDELLSQFCGTANCAAPEVLAGKIYEGGPADIWSLGVLLYFITAGRPTFSDTSFSGLKFAINRAQFHVPLWLSPDLVMFLKRMILADPEQRATISELRKHAWLCGTNNNAEVLDTDSTSFSLAEDPLISAQNGVTSPKAPHESMNAFELMASALDISNMLDKSPDSVLKKCHFTSRSTPSIIWQSLQLATIHQGGSLKIESPWRGRFFSGKDLKRPLVIDVEISTIHEELVLVSFVRRGGSQKDFYTFFNTMSNSKACANIIEGATKPSEISPDSTPLQSPLNSPMTRNIVPVSSLS